MYEYWYVLKTQAFGESEAINLTFVTFSHLFLGDLNNFRIRSGKEKTPTSSTKPLFVRFKSCLLHQEQKW